MRGAGARVAGAFGEEVFADELVPTSLAVAVDPFRGGGDDRREDAGVDVDGVAAGDDVRVGLEDLAAGRIVPPGEDLIEEIAALRAREKRPSKSS